LNSGGRYYCQPSNAVGTGSVAETLLHVYQEPKIEIPLKQQIKKRSGDTGYHVSCSAVGKPKPSIVWYKNNVIIDDATSNLHQISVTEQERGSNEAFNVLSTLKFEGPDRISKDHLMATDRGHYTCQFKNEVGEANSTMLLRIEHSPVVRHQHNKVAADKGETARIPCRMQAYPALNFEWSKGNSLLTQRPPHSMTKTQLGDDIYEGILVISHVEDSTYGEYSCKATNQLGEQKTIITLQPRGKPERPRSLRAMDTQANSVSLQFEEGFNGGYNQTTYNIAYTEVGSGQEKYHDCVHRNPCNISDLDQYTKYHFKIKAVNIRGHSDWSRAETVTTTVDVTKIPKPEHVYFETSSSSVSFNVINYSLGLIAKVELRNPDNSWTPHAKLGIDNRVYGEMKIDEPNVSGVRVKLCLATDGDLCGDYGLAEIVEVRQAPYSTASLPMEGVIAIVIFAVLLAIAAIGLVVKCCFFSQPTPKKLTKDDIAGPNRLANNAYNYGMDNKGVSAKDTADSPDIIKSQMYGYNYGSSVPAAQVPATGYESTSNSNNGGSVNSQDSLWNVKHGIPADPAVNGYIGAGYYGAGDPAQYAAQYNQQAQQYSQYGQPQPQQPYGQPQYNGQQQQQQAPPQQQQYNYEEYTHYPNPEDYLSERSRAYFPNGDHYAMPGKQQIRNRLDSDYSPYGDVSGLPDPYTGHDISDELSRQHYDLHSMQSSQEESGVAPPPEGYSTPSRRVIREIIV